MRIGWAACLFASLGAAAGVKIPAWAEDARGYRTDVPAGQWEVAVNDARVPVRSALGPADNLIVLLVSDLTGDLTRIEALRAALPEALGRLEPRHYAALLHASDRLRALVDPTPDREAIVRRFAELPAGGKAALLDTLESAAAIADGVLRKAEVRVAVLYLTDSSITNYRTDYTNAVINTSDRTDLSRRFPDRLIQERIEQLRRALETCQAPLFILHLQDRAGRLEEAYQNGLKTLAEDTAGEAVFCRTPLEVGPALDRLLERIRSGYLLAFDAPSGSRRLLRLRVALADGGRVRFRSRLAVK